MRYLALLLVPIVAYCLLVQQAPKDAVKEAVQQTEVAPLLSGGPEATPRPSSFAKRPIDRTHAVLDDVRQRNGDGEF